MSAADTGAVSAVAFQFAATLDRYEGNVAAMMGTGFDPELYRRVSRDMDEMRMYAASLPSLSVGFVEVMIRHFELTHGLWRVQREGHAVVDLGPLHGQLREAVQRLARKCTQLMPSA